jgi:hypothetical protein
MQKSAESPRCGPILRSLCETRQHLESAISSFPPAHSQRIASRDRVRWSRGQGSLVSRSGFIGLAVRVGLQSEFGVLQSMLNSHQRSQLAACRVEAADVVFAFCSLV